MLSPTSYRTTKPCWRVRTGRRSPPRSGPAKPCMVKRQMFGRAKLPLLRKRVLLTAAQGSHRHQA